MCLTYYPDWMADDRIINLVDLGGNITKETFSKRLTLPIIYPQMNYL